MSGNKKATDTNDGSKVASVPRLRFPEFRGAEGWKRKLVGPYLEDCSDRVPPDTELPIYSSTREGLKRQEAYFDGRVLQNKNEYGLVPPGCIVYRHMSDDGLFKFNINDTGGGIAVSKEYPVFSTNGLDAVFLLAKLNDGLDFKQFALSQKAGGTRTRLYFSRLREWETPLPTPAEQRKIADCLSSADEVIAAQAQKVDALKTHKKGLMQQLFPREGETQPRLRFPEFQNDRQWEEKRFADLCDIRHGYAFESEFFSTDGAHVLLTPGNFYEQGGYRDRGEQQKYFIGEIPSAYVLAKGDMLVAMTEQAAGLLGSPILVPESNKFLHNQRLGLVMEKPGVAWVNEFFFHVFNSQPVRKAIHDTAAGAKVRHTSPTKIGEVVLSVPTTLLEQRRIASCLTNLDALITANAQNLEALKRHKRGLMQQLFPSPDDVEE